MEWFSTYAPQFGPAAAVIAVLIWVIVNNNKALAAKDLIIQGERDRNAAINDRVLANQVTLTAALTELSVRIQVVAK